MSRFRFIAAEQASYPIRMLCRVLEVSTSGYYAWQKRRPSRRERANRALTEQLRAIHRKSRGTYGVPRMHAELRAQGWSFSRNRIARLMRQADLSGWMPRRKRGTTVADPSAQANDLVRREFTAATPDRVWVADITYVRTDEGWLYLAAILDLCSRRVVGWALADHLRTELATGALEMAITRRRPQPGLIHHSDRGCQYTALAYTTFLEKHGARQSLGRPGTCWDNAVAESFFATLKRELLDRQRWQTRQAAKTAIFEYVEGYYNRQRRHSTLAYRTPDEHEASITSTVTAA